ncbi:response regulator transcription factor [Hyphomicrobium sp. D-2]|uniref:response regulator transcription factor n=1 Tax=Hyphomicrobium sp. D-2 TaxID=3041621 RepID=UPI002453DE91|nr:response regulator transcription factor [Hyphomicrobium sp. D-2]MDH4981184.1 response regulator transcription factor [Hyphomicrobium sp. D-2]
MSHHIAIFDDDKEACAPLQHELWRNGFEVTVASDCDVLIHCVRSAAIDLVTLEISAIDTDGTDIIRTVRRICDVPVIIITPRGTPDDRVLGLESGADDYILKPFNMREVVLRIEKVLKRRVGTRGGQDVIGQDERYLLDFGILNVSRRDLRGANDEVIALTAAEFDLLTILTRHAGRTLSRDEIMRRLKGKSWSPLDRVLDKCIVQLRKKIEPVADEPILIKSIRSVGYIYAGNVTRI